MLRIGSRSKILHKRGNILKFRTILSGKRWIPNKIPVEGYDFVQDADKFQYPVFSVDYDKDYEYNILILMLNPALRFPGRRTISDIAS